MSRPPARFVDDPDAEAFLRDDESTDVASPPLADDAPRFYMGVIERVYYGSESGILVSDERGAGRRHPAVQARSLLAEMQRQSPHTPVAVVVWLDYDAPAGLDADAARSERAVAGAAGAGGG